MPDKNDSSKSKTPKYPFHEFMVDFLGGLVPGSLFLIGALFSLLPPLHLFYCLSNNQNDTSIAKPILLFLEKAQQTPNMIWIAFFSFIIAISYVLGHLFYRRGPKEPDRKSFTTVSKSVLLNKPDYLSDEEYLKRELACTNEKDCEFPYPYLREYLGQRGLCHLCPFVVWKNGETDLYRSKTYINLLKIRLKYNFPDKISNLIRNEAHVRLASSTWYVSRALRVCSILGTLIIIVAILIFIFIYFSGSFGTFLRKFTSYVPFLIAPLFILSTSEYMRSRIEYFIHYQRLREVFYVLETAYSAFGDKTEDALKLKPPFFDFNKNFSNDSCSYNDCQFKKKT